MSTAAYEGGGPSGAEWMVSSEGKRHLSPPPPERGHTAGRRPGPAAGPRSPDACPRLRYVPVQPQRSRHLPCFPSLPLPDQGGVRLGGKVAFAVLPHPSAHPSPASKRKARGMGQPALATPVGDTRVGPRWARAGRGGRAPKGSHQAPSGGLAGLSSGAEPASRPALPQPRAAPPVRAAAELGPSPWSRGAASAAGPPLQVRRGPRPPGLTGDSACPAAARGRGRRWREARRGLRTGGSVCERWGLPGAAEVEPAGSGRRGWLGWRGQARVVGKGLPRERFGWFGRKWQPSREGCTAFCYY